MSIKTIFLAGGCFWGVQRFLDSLVAVKSTETGYANSHNTKAVSYKEVCTGETGAVEAVKVIFDEELITLEELITVFFKIIDPTSLNKQGNDVGTQYRTGIYSTKENFVTDKKVIAELISNLEKNLGKTVVVENQCCTYYCKAEDYHQKYLENNPNGYCHLILDDFTQLINHYNNIAKERKKLKG